MAFRSACPAQACSLWFSRSSRLAATKTLASLVVSHVSNFEAARHDTKATLTRPSSSGVTDTDISAAYTCHGVWAIWWMQDAGNCAAAHQCNSEPVYVHIP